MLLWKDSTHNRGCDQANMLSRIGSSTMPAMLAVCIALLAAVSARAQGGDQLVKLINAYRAAPGLCEGRQARPVAPLESHTALAKVHIAPGRFLQQALKTAGYAAGRADAIYVSGFQDAKSVMAAIQQRYCRTLLSTEFTVAGASRTGDNWQIVLAQPMPPSRLRDWRETGQAILEAVNAARATPRICGDRQFAAAPALAWSAALGDAAFAHSSDMAMQRYLSHQSKDGSEPDDRATRTGYRWRRIGENIASGQDTPERVVADWLSSPGHCANIMNHDFTEMGAAYAIRPDGEAGIPYWTQVFGAQH